MIGIPRPTPGLLSLLFVKFYKTPKTAGGSSFGMAPCFPGGPTGAGHLLGEADPECELGSGRLHPTLTAEGATDSWGMPTDMSFTLELMPQQFDLLGQGLSRVLTSGRASEVPQRPSI